MREDAAVSSRCTRCLVAQDGGGETRWVSHRFSRPSTRARPRSLSGGERGSASGLRAPPRAPRGRPPSGEAGGACGSRRPPRVRSGRAGGGGGAPRPPLPRCDRPSASAAAAADTPERPLAPAGGGCPAPGPRRYTGAHTPRTRTRVVEGGGKVAGSNCPARLSRRGRGAALPLLPAGEGSRQCPPPLVPPPRLDGGCGPQRRLGRVSAPRLGAAAVPAARGAGRGMLLALPRVPASRRVFPKRELNLK